MPSTSNPFGLRPVSHPSGEANIVVQRQIIASGYASSMYLYQPIMLSTAGALIPVTASSQAFLGSFQGVEYTPTNGRPTYSPSWPGNTTLATNTVATALYTSDPAIIYEVQADGSVPAGSEGSQAVFSNLTATNGLGWSAATVSASLTATGQGQVRVIGVSLAPDSAWGDTFTVLQVQVANHQFVFPQPAI